MKLLTYFLGIISLLTLTAALADQDGGGDDTTTASPKPTTIYVTLTVDGVVKTVPTLYVQSFSPIQTEANAADFTSGTVGLGSQSGTVGGIRTYSQSTVSTGGVSNQRVYSTLAGALFLVFGYVL